jgi:hypothetical protein
MTIKQYIELDKINDQFNKMSREYIKQFDKKITDINKIKIVFNDIQMQLNNLTKYFYEQ